METNVSIICGCNTSKYALLSNSEMLVHFQPSALTSNKQRLLMSPKISLIGLGNRARQGKDCTAEYLQSKYDNIFIVHWADALKREVKNKDSLNLTVNGDRKVPLIYKDATYYKILNKFDPYGEPSYYRFLSEDVSTLNKLFERRNITEYWGDDDKDSEMLQFCGTDFRRIYCDKNYWVNQTMSSVNDIITLTSDISTPIFILIPDTRFINEYITIKKYNAVSYYWNITRRNSDYSRYYDPSRDKNHPSETELDDIKFDYKSESISGDIESLYYQATVNFENIRHDVTEFYDSVEIK